MAMFVWRVNPDGGEPYVVQAGTRDVLAWEEEDESRAADDLQERFRVVNAYWLAHHAAVRTGQFTGSLDEFKKSVDLETGSLVEVAEQSSEDSGVPTHPAP